MLGDYVAGHRKVTRFIPASEWAPVLAGLKAPLGVHAVLGNHDWWEDKTVQREGQGLPIAGRALEAAGIPVYENDARHLSKDGHPFWLAGLGDQLAYVPARRFRPLKRIGVDDLGATLAKVTDDAPVVLMAHEPDVARRVPSRVALQLSGHTHGGQVRMLGWSPVVAVRAATRLWPHRMNCDVVVSGGLGCSIMPFRLGVPPEIVLVTLGAPGRPCRNANARCACAPGWILRKTTAFQAIEGPQVTSPHLDGEIRDGRHHMQVRVYYEDTDFSGIVYHANYLRFMERGRTNHLRLMGADQHALFEQAQEETPGFAFVVRSMQLDFMRPARMDDVLDVVTWPVAVKGASITLAQEVRRGGEVLVKAEVRVAFISEGRAKPIPKSLRLLMKADLDLVIGR